MENNTLKPAATNESTTLSIDRLHEELRAFSEQNAPAEATTNFDESTTLSIDRLHEELRAFSEQNAPAEATTNFETRFIQKMAKYTYDQQILMGSSTNETRYMRLFTSHTTFHAWKVYLLLPCNMHEDVTKKHRSNQQNTSDKDTDFLTASASAKLRVHTPSKYASFRSDPQTRENNRRNVFTPLLSVATISCIRQLDLEDQGTNVKSPFPKAPRMTIRAFLQYRTQANTYKSM
ncbi:hypothetical protein BJ508DRAFT_306274 [Ascobolus immersus RN42]|uniref:Uncharacterized protein n=1 Tax=Ascobolus immersus RN42 TaxID=1160509 RepID=A0A3N4I6G9_ASCIM|nr:hypothetical protein BJ508DRAFT_306274 [Ascobolus immersus RN42]